MGMGWLLQLQASPLSMIVTQEGIMRSETQHFSPPMTVPLIKKRNLSQEPLKTSPHH